MFRQVHNSKIISATIVIGSALLITFSIITIIQYYVENLLQIKLFYQEVES